MPEHSGYQKDTSAAEWPRKWAVGIAAAILVVLAGSTLKAMAGVVIPVVLALFVTLAVLPLDRALTARLPSAVSWLGRVGVMGILVLTLSLFLGGLAFCVTQIATQLPDLSNGMDTFVPTPDGDGPWAQISREAQTLLQGAEASLSDRLIDTVSAFARNMAGATGALFAGMILVLFLILLALSEAHTWEGKLDSMAAGSRGSWRDVTETMGAALRRFIITRALVGVISAIVYTLWLLPFGMELLLVWAILTFLMNFIPNVGSFVSGVFPTVYAFFTLDFATAMIIGTGLIVIEQVIGNWIDPRLQGNQIALSPLVILISVIFWGWLWGVAGAFLGTPMTLSIMILCNAITPLRPVALVLSNRKRPEELDAALA